MEEESKIGFFKRLKMAIFNLEDYKIFANEKFSKALKYIFTLIAIITIILAVSTTVSFRQGFDKLVSYIKDEFPNFSYADESLSVDEKVEAYDEEYEAMLIVDTSDEVSDEQLEEYKDKASDGYYSVILLKNKLIYSVSGYEYEVTYSDFMNSFGLESLTKDELFENYLNDDGIFQVTFVIFIYAIIYLFVSNILTVVEDVLIVAIFGWLASKICKVALDFSKNCSLAVYSITLSLILSTVYSVAYTFTNFEIKYFSLMYMIIAYIYIIAAIMIMKSDPTITVTQEIPVKEVKKDDAIEIEKVGEKEEKPKDKEEDKEKDKEEKDKKDKDDKELNPQHNNI